MHILNIVSFLITLYILSFYFLVNNLFFFCNMIRTVSDDSYIISYVKCQFFCSSICICIYRADVAYYVLICCIWINQAGVTASMCLFSNMFLLILIVRECGDTMLLSCCCVIMLRVTVPIPSLPVYK